ncbi:MAG: hypothetical protein L6Q80_10270 [Dehalococcoidia bacterium]|nr:hypothetical protein [Dehalococcoidia bacterium]
MTAISAFRRCVEAIRAGKLITRESSKDKEFHFQNWFKARLAELGSPFEEGGRNSYPDFRMVQTTDGFELKGLAYPGRDATFDSNSQVPTGFHNGRHIYYVFGRYPKKPDGDSYPVIDLVLCHGDFLNADHEYKHKNKSVRGFGSYGDIMIRDRKMYVLPTPYRLVVGAAHHHTLILPAEIEPGAGLVQVGDLERREAEQLVVRYSFDLRTNELDTATVPNPSAGRVHRFRAWRLEGDPADPVAMAALDTQPVVEEEDDEE